MKDLNTTNLNGFPNGEREKIYLSLHIDYADNTNDKIVLVSANFESDDKLIPQEPVSLGQISLFNDCDVIKIKDTINSILLKKLANGWDVSVKYSNINNPKLTPNYQELKEILEKYGKETFKDKDGEFYTLKSDSKEKKYRWVNNNDLVSSYEVCFDEAQLGLPIDISGSKVEGYFIKK